MSELFTLLNHYELIDDAADPHKDIYVRSHCDDVDEKYFISSLYNVGYSDLLAKAYKATEIIYFQGEELDAIRQSLFKYSPKESTVVAFMRFEKGDVKESIHPILRSDADLLIFDDCAGGDELINAIQAFNDNAPVTAPYLATIQPIVIRKAK